MVAIVLVSAWFARVGSSYGSVLIVRRDRYRWYQAQVFSSLGALVLLGIFYAFHRFGAFTAILISVAKIIWVAIVYYRRANQLLGVKGTPSKEKRTAIVQLTLPAVPGVVYYALGGQISVFLITHLRPHRRGGIRRRTQPARADFHASVADERNPYRALLC